MSTIAGMSSYCKCWNDEMVDHVDLNVAEPETKIREENARQDWHKKQRCACGCLRRKSESEKAIEIYVDVWKSMRCVMEEEKSCVC